MERAFRWLLISICMATMLGCENTASSNDNKISDTKLSGGDETQDVRFAIRELWEAYCAQDEKRLNAIIDDDYVNADGTGKEAIIKAYLAPNLICKSVDVDYKHATIQINGNRAVVSYKAKYAISWNGAPLLKDNLSTDVFIKKNDQWRVLKGSAKEKVNRDTSQ